MSTFGARQVRLQRLPALRTELRVTVDGCPTACTRDDVRRALVLLLRRVRDAHPHRRVPADLVADPLAALGTLMEHRPDLGRGLLKGLVLLRGLRQVLQHPPPVFASPPNFLPRMPV